jgi:hypothetical protein
MDVVVILADPTVTSLGVGDQTFEVENGMARVPLSIAGQLSRFPHRYKLVPLAEQPAPVPMPSDDPGTGGGGDDAPQGADTASEGQDDTASKGKSKGK